MLSVFSLLPFLKGWEYKPHILSRTLTRGALPEEMSILERGWLMAVLVATNDCYTMFKIAWQGADLQLHEIMYQALAGEQVGAVVEDPSGWVQKYFRPNPNSSAGIFIEMPFNGLHGAFLPYIPTVKMSAWLPSESTQASAIISATAGVVAVTDMKAFIRSLRAVLAIKDLEIDPRLEVVGPL